MKKVLVAGATGYLGRYVLQEFKKQGYWIRALTRNAAKLESLGEYIDEKFIGKVTDSDSLSGICKDIDIVFSSVGITKQQDGLSYMDVDYQGNINLLEEAKREQIPKFIYVSVFNAEKMGHLKIVQAKKSFEEELKKSGLDFSIIRPNGFFPDLLEYLHMAEKGRGYTLGSGENKINPIHGEDLAGVCVGAAAGQEKEIDVGGPDTLSHNQILTFAFESLGKKVKISRIPIRVRNFLLKMLRIFTSVKTYGPLEFFMTVLAMDMIAPAYGKHHLKDFYSDNKNNEKIIVQVKTERL